MDFRNICLNPLSANLTKWSNTLKQFVGKLPANCLGVFDHFVGLVQPLLKNFVLVKLNFQAVMIRRLAQWKF